MNKRIYIYILFAIIMILVAGIYVDKSISINTAQPAPSSHQNTGNANAAAAYGRPTSVNYGLAPDFKAGDNWLNSQPLTVDSLKGKVVLVDFWTYSCINCIRTLPYVTKWYDIYKDQGLVVVGVHTPEFAFEKDANNVKNAITQFNIHYPVVQDNDYAIWNSYQNQYWPAEYLINQQGEIVDEHFGEGDYDKSENTIRYLLGMNANSPAANPDNLNKIGSPEMYFGTDRLQNLVPNQTPSSTSKNYTLNQNLKLNNFSLGGNWQFSGSDAKLIKDGGQINLKFHSGKLYMVASSQTPATLTIIVDGKKQPSVTIEESKLYTLFNSEDYADHVIKITINHTGFEAFTFTFG